MQKHLNEDRIAKMQTARMEKIKKTKGLIWDIGDGIEICADSRQFILKFSGESEQYYHFDCLDEIIRDIFYKKSTHLLIKNEQKNAEGVLNCLAEAKKWFEIVLAPALSPFTLKFTRKSLDQSDENEVEREFYQIG